MHLSVIMVDVYRYSYIFLYTVRVQGPVELLYILNRRLQYYTAQESCQCIFAASHILFNEPQSMLVLFYRAGKIGFSCYKTWRILTRGWRYIWGNWRYSCLQAFLYCGIYFFILLLLNPYTTSTFQTTPGRGVPHRSHLSIISIVKVVSSRRQSHNLNYSR